MKIIDFKVKGNLLRLYLGADDCTDYYGDDWNDRPYEHNAGTVYKEFVQDILDVAFPWNVELFEAADEPRFKDNSPYSKDDFKEGKAPFVVIAPEGTYDEYEYVTYLSAVGDKRCLQLYFNDNIDEVKKAVKNCNGIIFK